MCTTLRCLYIINKCVYNLVKAVIMLECYFYLYVILNTLTVYNLTIERLFALVDILNKFLDTTLIMESFFLFNTFS